MSFLLLCCILLHISFCSYCSLYSCCCLYCCVFFAISAAAVVTVINSVATVSGVVFGSVLTHFTASFIFMWEWYRCVFLLPVCVCLFQFWSLLSVWFFWNSFYIFLILLLCYDWITFTVFVKSPFVYLIFLLYILFPIVLIPLSITICALRCYLLLW